MNSNIQDWQIYKNRIHQHGGTKVWVRKCKIYDNSLTKEMGIIKQQGLYWKRGNNAFDAWGNWIRGLGGNTIVTTLFTNVTVVKNVKNK